MKVLTTISFDQDIEVDVSVEDIINAFTESPDSTRSAIRLISSFSTCVNAIDDEMIEGMTAPQRRIINEYFSAFAERF